MLVSTARLLFITGGRLTIIPIIPIYATPSAATPFPSVSHGFFRLCFADCVPCPSSTVLGISLIPGTGCPLEIRSTICAKLVG